MSKSKKPKSKGGRPRKVAEMIEGKPAANRFKSAMGLVLAAGPHPSSKTH